MRNLQPAEREASASAAEAAERVAALRAAVERVIRGKSEAVRLAVVTLLAGGHLLVEDVPGVGKTLLAKSLARSVGGTSGRVQGTADLMPADITGRSCSSGSPRSRSRSISFSTSNEG